MEQEEIKDLDKVEPIDYGVIAKPHTPIYKMHRYFARRPYTVFRELVKHYSNPGSIILDPMCGGGVTVVEGLRLKRKVIGVDLNPMATFITKCEVMDVDLDKLRTAFHKISEKVKNEIHSLYLTKCPKCSKETPADWFEWSNVVECPECKREVVFAETKKLKAGTYECPHCRLPIKSLKAKRKPDRIVRLKLRCECGFKGEKKPDKYDFAKYRWIEDNFDEIIKKEKLWYPKNKIFLGEKTREPLNKGFKYFYNLFTRRNILALSLLLNTIGKIKNQKIKVMLTFVFSDTLSWAHRMMKDPGHGFEHHAYWIPNIFLETNVSKYFNHRFSVLLSGKKYSQEEIGNYYREGLSFNEMNQMGTTCWLMAKSATSLKEIPDNSVDVIITDPPYGANVNYTELSDFWTIWLRDSVGVKNGLIDNNKEAIENKYQGKGSKEYRHLMYEIFKECYRVLKPNRWMVMTFHNRNFKVWSAIHLAAHDAGFTWSEKDGMIYQPPIQAYITTLHQRVSGAMLGDFILSYKKAKKPPQKKWIEEVEIGNEIRKIAKQAIEYHGGAKLSTIYMRVMPFLLNSGQLERMKENDIEPFLKNDFIKKDEKWYLKEHIDEETGKIKDIKIEEYAPVKERLEFIIRRFLAQGKMAIVDEILQVVYSRLINSNAAEYEEITHVINRICAKVSKKGSRVLYQLKEERDKGLLFELVKEKEEKYRYSEQSDHDMVIEHLVRLGQKKGYEAHIGVTEQKKYKDFKETSIPMGSNVQFGLEQSAFNRIKEIDVLWIKGISIVAAFEVEISTSIDSGITRFRELFAATPALNIPAFIVIPDKREKEAKQKIGSLANRREGITKKVKYLLFSNVMDQVDLDLTKTPKEVK